MGSTAFSIAKIAESRKMNHVSRLQLAQGSMSPTAPVCNRNPNAVRLPNPNMVHTLHHLCLLFDILRLGPVPELGRLSWFAAPTVKFAILLGAGKPDG